MSLLPVLLEPVVIGADRVRRLAPAPRLRFPPFQILAQGQLEPVLPRLLRRMFALAFVRLIVHCRPSSTLELSLSSENLAPLPQQTLTGWHAFVATGNSDLLPPLLSEHIVFRSPFVQSPIPGRAATYLVLTTVVQIFENFRYHREFVAGHDAALEFSANIGKWRLKGVDLIKFDADGKMIEFEVMVRPIKALQALGEEMGNRIGPELMRLKAATAGAH
jgi:hypothetical protein